MLISLIRFFRQRLKEKEEVGDGPRTKEMAKIVAENRYLNDKISQVDALEEEIAIYKVGFLPIRLI